MILASALLAATVARAAQPLVVKMVLDDTIQPVTAAELERTLDHARQQGAQAVLIELDTPGGLLDSTRAMAGAILGSPVPVIVYVTPAGARAGSAGFFLMEAADVAAMTPGTNAGAAHPVAGVGKMDETMAAKVTNDAEAFLRSYVTRRGRNAEAAELAVHASHSYTPQEALDAHLIDAVANNELELLSQIDGRQLTRMDGGKLVLHTAGARLELLEPTLRDRILGWLVNPNIALLFLIGGALLIYLEFNTPGTIVPGALGTLMVLVAVFGLNLLPVRFTSVLLLLAAMALLALEAKIGGHGVLAVAGIVCLTLGTLTLVAAPIPEMAVHPMVALAVGVGFGGITVFLVRIAVRAKRRKSLIGPDALVGLSGKALEPLSPVGHVLVNGEIWQARAAEPIASETPVIVLSHEGYVLHVEAM
jgi:membrane-bound serine protease (ClpP class)